MLSRSQPGSLPQAALPLSLCLEFVRAEDGGDPYAFRFAPQQYLLRGPGGSFEGSRFLWEAALLADLKAVRRPGRDPALPQKIGEVLRQFLTPLGWPEQESLLLAAVKDGQRVVVTIRSAASELYALPWELLTLKSTGQHLGELPGVQIRYEWPATHSAPEPAPRAEGGRILVAWSASAGAVPAREHIEAVLRACQAGAHPFVVERDVLAHASCASLNRALETAAREGPPIAVLHLLCHGAQAGSTFGLALNGEGGGADPDVADAGRLRQLLAPYAAMVRLVVLAACDSGNSGALGNQLGSVAQTLHRAGFAAVVASRYPLSVPGSIRLTEALYQDLLVAPNSLEHALLAARQRLAPSEGPHLDWASLQLYARAEDGDDTRPVLIRPYRGLLAFQPEHGRFFFGRQREEAAILEGLQRLQRSGAPRFLVVAGASGTGKSSVVMAGAVPRLLAAPGGLRLLRMRPGSEPEQALDALLGPQGGASVPPPDKAAAPALLVVDQLEEIFTHVENPGTRGSFVQRLWKVAADPHSGVTVIVTLRVDYIGRCGEVAIDPSGRRLDSIAYDEHHRVFIGQLTPDSMRLAIEEPARKVGLALEGGLSRRMLADVAGEPGALPLLADTLDLLWQRRAGHVLTQEAYVEIGGVTGALRGRTEALFGSLSTAEQETVHRLLVRLVSIGDDAGQGTRRRVLLRKVRPAEPPDAARFDRIVRLLVAERLLVLDGEGKAQTVEVAHEALIRGWQRLAEWVREDRHMLVEMEKLEALVEQWKQHGTLLTGNQLAYAETLAARYPAALSPEARTLLAASRKRARWWWFFKRLATAASAVLAVIFATLWWDGRKASLKLRYAQQLLLSSVKQVSSTQTSPEMLMLLAQVQLGIEERPDQALLSIEQARELAPEDPDILVTWVGCLMINGRPADVLAAVHAAWPASQPPAVKAILGVTAWAAAWMTENEPEAALWAPRVVQLYEALGDGIIPLKMHLGIAPSMVTRYLFRFPQRAVILTKVVRVFTLLLDPKTPATTQTLRELLLNAPG